MLINVYIQCTNLWHMLAFMKLLQKVCGKGRISLCWYLELLKIHVYFFTICICHEILQTAHMLMHVRFILVTTVGRKYLNGTPKNQVLVSLLLQLDSKTQS